FKRFPEERREFAIYCFWIAKEIANPGRFLKDDPSGVVKCLHSIVSGDLDADRCDYVRRDGYASGFEFGDYDIQRILSAVRFRRNPEKGKKFELVPTTVATSALESFFLERYRIYKWLIFHPMVVRVNVALARALAILLEIAFREETGGKAEKILQILEDTEFDRTWKSLANEDSYHQYALCDENWLLTLLREVQQLGLSDPSQALPIKQLALGVYLDLVCDRKKEHIQPLWKRQEGYQEFAEKAAEHLNTLPGISPELVKGEKEDDVAWCNRFMETILMSDVKKKGRVATMRQLEEKIQSSLALDGWCGGVIADVLPFTPYESFCVLDTRTNKLVPLEGISMIVRGLSDMWSREIRFRPFWWARKMADGGYQLEQSGRGKPPGVTDFAKAFVGALLK
ncbi:MAG: hypothetical protein ACRD2L_01535, partial [Terriglobia bacterium]